MSKVKQIRHMLNRIARLDAGEGWLGDLNPAQRAAVEYLANANRFSRSPSHVANYLGTTRGTMTQTLKALKQKGYVTQGRLENNKRSITYELTNEGRKVVSRSNVLLQTLRTQPQGLLDEVEQGLYNILKETIEAGGYKPFGVCRNCRYFNPRSTGGFCDLLSVKLSSAETEQICHEQDPI